MVYTEHLLSLCDSGILVCARQTVSAWSVPSKNLEYRMSNEFPWLATFHVAPFNAGGIKWSCVTPLGEDSWGLAPGLLWILVLFLILLLINHSCEYDYILPVNHWTWGWSCRPQHKCHAGWSEVTHLYKTLWDRFCHLEFTFSIIPQPAPQSCSEE